MRKVISLLIIGILAFGFIACDDNFGNTTLPSGTKFWSGNRARISDINNKIVKKGDAEFEIIIDTPEEFAGMMKNLNAFSFPEETAAKLVKPEEKTNTLTVKLNADFDMDYEVWQPATFENRKINLVLDGQNHTIFNLHTEDILHHAGLFGRIGQPAKKSPLANDQEQIGDVTIKNLILEDAEICGDSKNTGDSNYPGVKPDKLPSDVGVGGFIGFANSNGNITVENCKVIDSDIEGGNWTGGIIGGGQHNRDDYLRHDHYTIAYEKRNNQKEFIEGLDQEDISTITIKDVSVIDTELRGVDNSIGTIIGYATLMPQVECIIENPVIEDCEIFNELEQKGRKTFKAGEIVGTSGWGKVVINYQSDKVKNNRVEAILDTKPTEIKRIYGRIGFNYSEKTSSGKTMPDGTEQVYLEITRDGKKIAIENYSDATKWEQTIEEK